MKETFSLTYSHQDLPLMYRRWFLVFLVLPLFLFSEEDPYEQLFKDLEIVELVDKKIADALPLIVNYQLQGGYFAMPSARTFKAGHMGLSFSYLPPYHVWNLGFQFFDRIETTGNYWVYKGVLEGNFGHQGFGDDAERAANVKFILLKKEDGFPFLPEFAIGWNDFFGSCRFHSFYVAATKQFLEYNFEATLGWGHGRIHGFYGGVSWTPFHSYNTLFKDLSFIAEYDANDYKKHATEHPDGRTVKSKINGGVQLNLWDLFRLTFSSIRGEKWAAGISFNYNLGEAKGFFPKIYDIPVYTAPVNHEPVGVLRTRAELAQDLGYACKEQGFTLCNLYLIPKEKGKDQLWMKVINTRYREEEEVRGRIQKILGGLVPSNITETTVVLEADGVEVQEYRFRTRELARFFEGKMGENEFRVVAPLEEVGPSPKPFESASLYSCKKPVWILTFRPWLKTFFGSSRGKFKYETGLSLGSEGYFFNEVFYSIKGSYTAASSTSDLGSWDTLNPSRMINVRTDAILYNKSSSFHLDQAYLQKSWNIGSGWFARVASGYFEIAYAGLAAEALYFPVRSWWAIGFEGATVWKRSYFGVGFQRKIRKMTNKGIQYFPYTGLQYFLNFYYQYTPYSLDFKASIGQFLARDKGIRIEGSRSFPSGLRFGLWYTFTNANDIVNQKRYYDKGFFFSMPFDLFLNKTSRTRIGYAMAAWLRDCGAAAFTGKDLYSTIYWERYNTKEVFY